MNTSTKFDFVAPFVPAADPVDGLLPVDALTSPVNVSVTLWDAMQPSHYIQLILNGNLIGPRWTISETNQPGDVVSMEIEPLYSLDEGTYVLGFRATNPENGTQSDSESVRLIVDRTAPGGSLIAPLIFANISVGDLAYGKVPGYSGMQAGDIVQTLCNGVQGPTYRVRTENLSSTPIEITFTQEFFEGLFGYKVNISYHITDRAGNRSILAQSVELTLQH